jgi:hypothetical protein
MASCEQTGRVGAAGLGAIAASVAVAAALVGCGGGGDDDAVGGGGIGAAAGGNETTVPSGNGSVATITPTEGATTSSTAALAELPPPAIPGDAAPPTTAPGTEPLEIPEGPMFGEFVVDVDPDGFVDVPVSLRQGQNVSILSNADDGIYTHISVYAPDSSVLGEWDGGQPEVINGWTFDDEDPLPTDGVYVIRVQHRSGRDDPFMLRFYGES